MLVDTSLIIYATFTDTNEHQRAREWLVEQTAGGDGSVVLCWPVLYAFVRLASSIRVFGSSALRVFEAWATAEEIISQPSTRLVSAGARHARIAAELAATPGLRSDDVPDIEIAALAIEHGLVLATHDSGFRRFGGLRVHDPLGRVS
ncbi:MAG: TA system VapC family ribonuclease toxin [Acidimicrobiia bacterium]